MSKPSLPPLVPPAIPKAQISPKKSGGSDILFILMLTALTFMIMQQFTKQPQPQNESFDQEPAIVNTIDRVVNEETIASLDEELVQAARQENKPTFVTLGSLDEKSNYRMLVTLDSQGAAVHRIELNEIAFNDTHDRTGYLGQIVPDETIVAQEFVAGYPGIRVQSVGIGTPAAVGGLAVGDRIMTIAREEGNPVKIDSFDVLRGELLDTRPGQTITLGVIRKQALGEPDRQTPEAITALSPEDVKVTLRSAPVSIVRPEGVVRSYSDYQNLRGLQGKGAAQEAEDLIAAPDDFHRKGNSNQPSFLMSLASYDSESNTRWSPPAAKGKGTSAPHHSAIDKELSNMELRTGCWEYLQSESSDVHAVFRKIDLARKLEFRKIYTIAPGTSPDAKGRKSDQAKEYHLALKLEIRNLDVVPHSLSYLLDGPTGLPIEGAWYSSGRKTGPGWGIYGLRDIVVDFNRGLQVVRCLDIANDTILPSERVSLDFIGVDTQYFQCTILPQTDGGQNNWHESYVPIRVGVRDKAFPTLTNTSFRLKSNGITLAPKGEAGAILSHEYQIFAGPKKPEILNQYHLGETLVYGWFWFVSIPLLWILHFFHNYLVFNYGLAIVMLTIVVRLLLFPLSMKQVVSSLKMQKVQPQMAALKEKYKDEPQEMMRAQQQLFRENGVNPLSGCLPIFIQLPIFIGLYKALSLDVSLYGAPLFTHRFRWCSNLAAPDMIIDWSQFWNSIGWNNFNMGNGMFYLGPFFNLLPLLTIALFLVQQKFLMPPVVGNDEAAQQQRMMRRMMNFMMLFMGFLFFKVPSGLCVYFIVSSLWGIFERQFHPKVEVIPLGAGTATTHTPSPKLTAPSSPNKTKNEGGSKKSKRQRNRPTMSTGTDDQPKGTWRAWWDGVLEKAKEQQRITKADAERRKKR